METRTELHHGDALDVLRKLPDASVHSIATDPPAGISFMGKSWDGNKGGRDAWVAWLREILEEALRVLKPGGHAVIWALPRTSHWTATAIEDAGFEIRDVITHLFGTGFPKSHNVFKFIDKMLGTEAAEPWSGFGTALKPGSEHWILARKPRIGTVAANVLAHGTGALNIDGCRIGTGTGEILRKEYPDIRGDNYQQGKQSYKDRPKIVLETKSQGRWPANLILSHSPDCVEVGERAEDITTPVFKCAPGCPAAELDAQSGKCVSRFFYAAKASKRERNEGLEDMPAREYTTSQPYGKGDKARKASGKKGNQNDHPTIKSIALMRYLCRLITPPGGTVLDPFMGSGTTGIAARQEGFGFIGIEQDEHNFEISKGRIGK